MRVCLKCGQVVGEGDAHCKRCGASLDSSPATANADNKKHVKIDCPICHGQGMIKSRSILTQNEECPGCNGKRKFDFYLEPGEKLISCPRCKGNGFFKTGSLNKPNDLCEICGHSGKVVD